MFLLLIAELRGKKNNKLNINSDEYFFLQHNFIKYAATLPISKSV